MQDASAAEITALLRESASRFVAFGLAPPGPGTVSPRPALTDRTTGPVAPGATPGPAA
jgi:hypothetical protein